VRSHGGKYKKPPTATSIPASKVSTAESVVKREEETGRGGGREKEEEEEEEEEEEDQEEDEEDIGDRGAEKDDIQDRKVEDEEDGTENQEGRKVGGSGVHLVSTKDKQLPPSSSHITTASLCATKIERCHSFAAPD